MSKLSRFFVYRPIFAWVLAILISASGLLSVLLMPVEQYPDVVPPIINIDTIYPGATAQQASSEVSEVIEKQLNGLEHLLYFTGQTSSNGAVRIMAIFLPGTDPQLAQVQVQNKVSNIESRLPALVRQQGIRFSRGQFGFLMVVSLTSTGRYDSAAIQDYITRHIQSEVARVPGVGAVKLFFSNRALRIWTNPEKLSKYGLTSSDIAQIVAHNSVPSQGGQLGGSPAVKGQQITVPLSADTQLSTPEAFANIALRTLPNGQVLRLKDVAKVELGEDSYLQRSDYNGKPAASFAITLAPGANALKTAKGVETTMERLSSYFPAGIQYAIPYNTAPQIKDSLSKVVETLFEAIALVFVVMFLFLQNVRYTIIPAVVVPIALLGTITLLFSFGFTINLLTLFAMVLAIGILVDDAIVVVENVERIIVTEHLPPRLATLKAMPQIGSAIVGITLALCTVFLPLLFFVGSSGVIYRQFAATMMISIALSAILALTFTPALCATLLTAHNPHEKQGWFFRMFNKGFDATSRGYQKYTQRVVTRPKRMFLIYLVLSVFMGYTYYHMPSSFLPSADQGVLMTPVQLPTNASAERTSKVIRKASDYYMNLPEVESVISVQGFSLDGIGNNTGMLFTILKDFKDRTRSADQITQASIKPLFYNITDGRVFPLTVPPIPALGSSAGFQIALEDRANLGEVRLRALADRFLKLASQSPVLRSVRIAGMGVGPAYKMHINRDRAAMEGVPVARIAAELSSSVGGGYVGTFSDDGQVENIWVQADPKVRSTPMSLRGIKVRNDKNQLVDLSSLVTITEEAAESQINHFNGYPAFVFNGEVRPGYSDGDGIKELKRLYKEMNEPGLGYEWGGLSLQTVLAGGLAPVAMSMAMIVVFLVLAALYESWAIPLATMMIVPLGMLGTVVLTQVLGLDNNIYFQVGMITVIGLSVKNAILIIEFAKDAMLQGMSLMKAVIQGASLRFRPILMTSMAFILGVLPLVFATGAGHEGQKAVGVSVLGGMLAATPFSLLFVPVFFVMVMGLFKVKVKNIHKIQGEDGEKLA